MTTTCPECTRSVEQVSEHAYCCRPCGLDFERCQSCENWQVWDDLHEKWECSTCVSSRPNPIEGSEEAFQEAVEALHSFLTLMNKGTDDDRESIMFSNVRAWFEMKKGAKEFGLEPIEEKDLYELLRFFSVGYALRDGMRILFVFSRRRNIKAGSGAYWGFSHKRFTNLCETMKSVSEYARKVVLGEAWFGFGTVLEESAPKRVADFASHQDMLGSRNNTFRSQIVWTFEMHESEFMLDSSDNVFLRFDTKGRIYLKLNEYLRSLGLLPWDLEVLLDSYMSIEDIEDERGFGDPKLVFRDAEGEVVRVESLRDVPHSIHLDSGELVSYTKTDRDSIYDEWSDRGVGVDEQIEWSELQTFYDRRGREKRKAKTVAHLLKGSEES